MLDKHICPICLAFCDPDTDECLVCGKRYYVLNVPVSQSPQLPFLDTPANYLIPYNNGYLTFCAAPTLTVESTSEEMIGQTVIVPNNRELTLSFKFIPNSDNVLYTLYTL